MNKNLCAVALFVVLLSTVRVHAEEVWDPRLRGVDEGAPSGALPPKGLYFLNTFYVSPDKRINESNGKPNPANLKLQDWVEVPLLLWVPGVTVLGADYGAAVAQPIVSTNLSMGNGTELGGHVGTFNTVAVPAILSWSLPADFHVRTAFAVYVNDASSSAEVGHLPSPSTAVPSGMANWTFAPSVGVSWLHDGWNVSVLMEYDTSTADPHSSKSAVGGKYQSGDQVALDYTIAKTVKEWTVGVGAYQLSQLERDKFQASPTTAYGPQLGTMNSGFALGPIVGYDFGKIKLEAVWNHPLMIHNDSAGDNFFVRAVVPLL